MEITISEVTPLQTETLLSQMRFIEQGGQVQRMHTIPTLRSQNVAAHSFGVAWWCYLLIDSYPSPWLLLAALAHDLPEALTGDIPSPAKVVLDISRSSVELENKLLDSEGFNFTDRLSSEERRILALADALELMQHCIRERSMGNRTAQLEGMYSNISKHVGSLPGRDFERKVFEILLTQWEQAA
jgi:5'-deoxynucleotidase YfbR-like HD superfamily hydrolase